MYVHIERTTVLKQCVERNKCFGFTIKIRGEDVMRKIEEYALKDSKGNYVGINSITFDEITKQDIYSSSEQLINGFYTYSSELDAITCLHVLRDKGIKIKFGIQFHIEKIDIMEVMIKEHKMGIKKCPFKYEIIKGGMTMDDYIKRKIEYMGQ